MKTKSKIEEQKNNSAFFIAQRFLSLGIKGFFLPFGLFYFRGLNVYLPAL